MLSEKYSIGSLVLVLLLLACSKKESFDIKGDPEVKFFTNNESLGNFPPNAIAYTVVHHPAASGSGLVTLTTSMPGSINIPVFANRPVGEDVTIGALLDNSLIEQYNAAHNTSYVAFPAPILNTGNLTALIPKGSTVSSDSIRIQANVAELNTLTGKAYMAPIRLTTVSKPGVGAITSTPTTQIAYIILNTELRRIRYLAPAADAQGSLISPKGDWEVTLSPQPIMVGSIIDGSTTTFSRWGVSASQVDVNMQTVQSITGIRLHTSTSANMTPTQVEVYLSEDGINYDHIGTPLRANMAFVSGYNYILFYNAIPAKYIRLNLTYSTSTNTQNRRLTELDVYAL